MPIIKSAAKRMRQTSKRRARNVVLKREIKDTVKTFLSKPSAQNLSKAQSKLDIAVKKNLLKKNTAARRKAQLSKVAKDNNVKMTKATTKKSAAKSKAKAKTTKKSAPKKPAATKKPPSKKSSKS